MADQRQGLRKSIVIHDEGSRIGSVGRIYLDDATGEVTFLTARAGLFGQREVFVPLAGALVSDGLVEVPFSTELVKRAPLATDDPHLTPDQEAAILRHYGLPFILPEPSSLN